MFPLGEMFLCTCIIDANAVLIFFFFLNETPEGVNFKIRTCRPLEKKKQQQKKAIIFLSKTFNVSKK